MLPFFTLQSIQLETNDVAREGPQLLPADATEPTARFAELLRINVEDAGAAPALGGIGLPVAGNALPTPDAQAAWPGPQRASGSHGAPPFAPAPAAAELSPVPRAEPARPEPSPTLNGAMLARDAWASPLAAESRLTPPNTMAARSPNPPPAGGPAIPLPAADATTLPTDIRDLTSAARQPRLSHDAEAPAGTQQRPEAARAVVPPLADVARSLAVPRNDALPRSDAQPLPQPPRDALPREFAATPTRVTPAAERGDARPPALAPAPTPTVSTAPAAPVPAPAAADFVPPPQGTTIAPAAAPLPGNAAAPAAEPALPAPQLHSTINVPVQDPAWGGELGERVQLMANGRLQSAEIRLTPAELGPVRVQVAVDDGNASVTFHAQHALTREAIEQAMPRLRELLSDSGLTLQQANVAGDNVQQGSRQAGDGEREALAGAAGGHDDDVADGADTAAGEAPGRAPRGDGLVDTYA